MTDALPQLAGTTEAADILGVTRQRVWQLRQRDDFPVPVMHLAAGPIWTRASLEAFATARVPSRNQTAAPVTEKRGPTIPVTESMILHAAEDANLMLLDGDLPRHDSEPVWDYHRRVQDEIGARMAAGTKAALDRILGGNA